MAAGGRIVWRPGDVGSLLAAALAVTVTGWGDDAASPPVPGVGGGATSSQSGAGGAGGHDTEAPVRIVELTASLPEVSVGDSVEIAWRTENASACSFVGGSAGWREGVASLPAGATSVVIDFEGPRSFGLSCTGEAGDTAVEEVVVTGVAAEVPPDCSVQDVDEGVDFDWSDIFFATFPDKLQSNHDRSMFGDEYFSVAFHTGAHEGTLSVSTVALQGGVRWLSISRCPGQFTTNTPPACTFIQGIGGALQASTDPNGSGCVLEPDTDYFINVTYVDVDDQVPTEETSCPGYCTVRFTASFN